MTVDLEDLKRRLVVGHKRGGRCVYDEGAKAELVELCRQSGASLSRLARECGINTNQVSRWVREQDRVSRHTSVVKAPPSAFVAVPVATSSVMRTERRGSEAIGLSLQARLPNGVTVELRGAGSCEIGEAIQALGRLPCSV